MKLLNDDFGHIVEIFENAIVKELEVIKADAETFNDRAMLGRIESILNSDDIIPHLIELIDSECFLQDFLTVIP